jgi:hypothetical protein
MSTKDEKRLVIVTMVTKRLVKSHETPDPARPATRRSGFLPSDEGQQSQKR